MANAITGNVATGETAVSGGVALLAEPGGVPAEHNVVSGNLLAGNAPDVFWDGAGMDNVFRGPRPDAGE